MLTAELKPDAPCGICAFSEEHRNAIDRLIANGATVSVVQGYMADNGLKVWHRNTVSRHKVKHCKALVAKRAAALRADVKAIGSKSKLPTEGDIAQIVAARARERLLDPNDDLDVTIAEGLRAQEILDKRGQASSVRDIVLQFIAVSSGAVPAQIVEGISQEILELDATYDEQEAQLNAIPT